MIKIILILVLTCIVLVSAQTCNNTEDCSNNGLCSNNQCHCFSGYITHESVVGCNYRQKSRLTAFMLELFLGEFGAGWFYLDRNEFAIPVIVLTLFLVCCVAPLYKTLKSEHVDEDTLKMSCTMCLYLLILLTVLGFWLHGVIVTGNGDAKDSNGVSVGDW